MLSAERIALLKHGAPPRNALEAALRNAWGGGGASYEKTVGPAPIISIADAKAKPAKSLIVGMEPIQDLHGYDSPWPAGGGKNLFNGANYVSGTLVPVHIAQGTIVTASAKSTASVQLRYYDANQTQIDYWSMVYNSELNRVTRTFAIINSDCEYIAFVGDDLNYLQVELGSTATAFAPYSNICPITGRTGVTAERTGKNLFDFSSTIPYSSASLDVSILSNGYRITPAESGNKTIRLRFGVLKAGQYSASVSIKDKDGQGPSGIYWMVDGGTGVSITNPISADGKTEYGFLFFGSNEKAPYDVTDIQLQLGSTKTAYAPYSGATYPISWQSEAGTVYGGTVDLVSGVLTVDRAKHVVSSGSGWVKSTSYPGGFYRTRGLPEGTAKEFTPFICSHAKSVNSLSEYINGTCYCDGSLNIRIMDSDATWEDWNTYCVTQYNGGTPIEICYELATPITYQLTTQQIQLLKGANVLWSDADSLTLTYLGTTPANLLGGMLGGGLGGAQEPIEETSEEPVSEEPTEEPTEGDNE